MIYGAYLLHVPAHWIAVGAIVLLGLGGSDGCKSNASKGSVGIAVVVLRSFGQLPIDLRAKNIGSQGWPSEIVLGRAQLLLVRGLSLFVGGASGKRIVHLLDAGSKKPKPKMGAC